MNLLTNQVELMKIRVITLEDEKDTDHLVIETLTSNPANYEEHDGLYDVLQRIERYTEFELKLYCQSKK